MPHSPDGRHRPEIQQCQLEASIRPRAAPEDDPAGRRHALDDVDDVPGDFAHVVGVDERVGEVALAGALADQLLDGRARSHGRPGLVEDEQRQADDRRVVRPGPVLGGILHRDQPGPRGKPRPRTTIFPTCGRAAVIIGVVWSLATC